MGTAQGRIGGCSKGAVAWTISCCLLGAVLPCMLAVASARSRSREADEQDSADKKWVFGAFDLREAPWIFAFRFIPGLLLQHVMFSLSLFHSPTPPVLVYFPSTPATSPAINLYGQKVTGRSLSQVLHACIAFLAWSLAEGVLYAHARALGPGLFQDMAAVHWILVILLFRDRDKAAETLMQAFRRHARVYVVYLILLVLRNLLITVFSAVAAFVVIPLVTPLISPSLDPATAPIWLPVDRNPAAAPPTSTEAGETSASSPAGPVDTDGSSSTRTEGKSHAE